MSVLRFSVSMAMTVALVAVLFEQPPSVCGWDRSGGDYWAYDLEMIAEGVLVAGTLSCDFVGNEPAPYADFDDTVDVFRVSGHFEGEMSDSVVNTSAAGILDGWNYRVRGSTATVMNEMTMIVNLTQGVGTTNVATSIEAHDKVLFRPPLMSEFDEGSAVPGVAWNETVEAERAFSFDDGSSSYDEDGVSDELYSFLIESVDEAIETEAGEFNCILVNMSYESGYEIIWHCHEVGMPVMIERYDNELSAYCFIAVLAEHSVGDDSAGQLLILIGVGIAGSAILLVAMVALVVVRSRATVVLPAKVDSDEGCGDDGDLSEEDVWSDDNRLD